MSSCRIAFLLVMASVVACVASLPDPASAARSRPSVIVKSDTVRLSDLFSDLEAGQDCNIGPAPEPGGRIVIGQPQLAAIAAQFGVDWQSGVLPAQIVLERQGRSITRDELLPPIRSALVAAGAPGSIDVSLNAFTTLMIPAEITGSPDVESLNYDRNSGHFTAQLSFGAPNLDQSRLRITGTAQEMVDVPVLARTIGTGTVLSSADLLVRRLRRGLVSEKTLLSAEDAVGLAARHRLGAGNPISLDELSRPLLVSRGMSVVLRLEDTGLVLIARGEAIDGGALGDRIHVLNPTSRAILIARVTGSATVQVDPTSAPIVVTAQPSGLPPAYSLAAIAQSPGSSGIAQ